MPSLNMVPDQLPNLPEVSTTAAAGEFELFFNDINVEPEKQTAYILSNSIVCSSKLMMAADCVTDFSIYTVFPYSEFMSNRKLGGGGWVRKLSANKEIVVKELMRRDPNAKPNKSNRSCEELLRLFKPLTDRRDVDFVSKKELEVRQKMEAVLAELNTKKNGQSQGQEDGKGKPPKRPKIEEKHALTEGAAMDVQLNLAERAQVAMDAAEKAARENGFKVAIAIVNSRGEPMLVKRLEGAYPHSFDLAMTKAKIACHFQKNTSQLHEAPDISRGGVPFMSKGICIGGIGVSGDKQLNCEKVAYAAVDKLKEEAKQESVDSADVITQTSV